MPSTQNSFFKEATGAQSYSAALVGRNVVEHTTREVRSKHRRRVVDCP